MRRSFATGNGGTYANGSWPALWWRESPWARPESSWTLTLGRDPA